MLVSSITTSYGSEVQIILEASSNVCLVVKVLRRSWQALFAQAETAIEAPKQGAAFNPAWKAM